MDAKNSASLFMLFLAPGLILGFPGILQAQSTLEYSSLVSTVSAAATSKNSTTPEKKDPVTSSVNKVYSSSEDMLSKSADLLAQAGSGRQPVPENEIDNKETGKNKIAASAIDNTAHNQKTSSAGKTTVKVFLHDGTVVEGGLIGYGKNTIQVDVDAVPVTYFNDDIKRIEEYSP